MQKAYKIYIDIVAALLILLFVYTALSKFAELQKFRAVLHSSPLIYRAAPVVSVIIPSVELIVALLLFFPSTKRRGLWASFVLMALFTFYITYILLFAEHLPCSCGGVISGMSWPMHLGFNLGILAITGVAVTLHTFKDVIAIHRTSRKPA